MQYAHIANGVVDELHPETVEATDNEGTIHVFPLASRVPTGYLAECVLAPDDAQVGWLFDGSGFGAPVPPEPPAAPPPPTLAQLHAQAASLAAQFQAQAAALTAQIEAAIAQQGGTA